MSELLSSVAAVEKELGLLENILNYIFIYDMQTNNLIVKLKISQDAVEFDSNIIGGLVGTIQEFGGVNVEKDLRFITLENLKLIFLDWESFIIVLACDPEYPLAQFEKFMEVFIESFIEGYNIQDYGAGPDGVSISFQIIKSLISEDFDIDLKLGDKARIFPLKLKELADDIIDKELKRASEDFASAMTEYTPSTQGETDNEGDIELEVTNIKDAMHALLDKFVNTFSDILSITLIHSTQEGNLERITKGTIGSALETKILNIILGMIDTVSIMLEQGEEERTLDLDDHWIYFQQISLSSFIYIIVENKESLELVKPLVERISITIKNLFPEEVM